MSETTTSWQRAVEQRRAEHAWKVVATFVEQSNGKTVIKPGGKQFGTQAKRLPVRILTAGLGQALAFLHAKKTASRLLTALGDWVLDKRADPESRRPEPDETALLRAIIAGDTDRDQRIDLRRATDETLAYLQWLNRFAEAEGLTDETDGRE